MKRAIIVGHKGQDGTLLSQDLLKKGYSILGVGRESVSSDDHKLFGSTLDITKPGDVEGIMEYFRPDEVYYLAAHHNSSEYSNESFNIRDLYVISHQVHVTGLLNFLSSIVSMLSTTRLFYASSSMIFSGQKDEIQDENTPIDPQCIYGITKAQGMWLCREFRKKHKVFSSSGILFNHESHFRPERFLPSKVINSAIRIVSGLSKGLEIGSLKSIVDWGYAPDYVKAFQDILELDYADDFIISTGEGHSVEELIDITFSYFGLDWKKHVAVNTKLLNGKPTKKIGDAKKLRTLTGWQPSYTFDGFVHKLIEDHLEAQGLFELKRKKMF